MSVFDHFVKLALKGLKLQAECLQFYEKKIPTNVFYCEFSKGFKNINLIGSLREANFDHLKIARQKIIKAYSSSKFW